MIALSRHDDKIYMRDSETLQESVFRTADGTKIRGDLEVAPNEVLYMAWRQTQSVTLKESQLRKVWENLKK